MGLDGGACFSRRSSAAPFTALASRLLFEPKAPRLRRPRLHGVRAPAPARDAPARGARVPRRGGRASSLPAVWVLALCFYLNEVVVLERATRRHRARAGAAAPLGAERGRDPGGSSSCPRSTCRRAAGRRRRAERPRGSTRDPRAALDLPGGWERDRLLAFWCVRPLRGDVPVSPLHQCADADRRVGRPDAVRGDRGAGDGRRVRAKLGSVCTCGGRARVDLAGTGRMRRAVIGIAIGAASLSAAERIARRSRSTRPPPTHSSLKRGARGWTGSARRRRSRSRPRTRDLCPLAGEVTGCDGLVAACGDEAARREKDLPDFSPGPVGSILSAHRERPRVEAGRGARRSHRRGSS